MTLSELRTTVRRDLRDEDSGDYRWSDEELDRHIGHAVREFSQAIPREEKAALPTAADSLEIDLSPLADLVMVEAVEYPIDRVPPCYRRFRVWGSTLAVEDGDTPDGSDCCVYYGGLHTLDEEGSTIPPRFEDLVAAGTEAYALLEWAAYALNRTSIGGEETPARFLAQGQERLVRFQNELRRYSYRNRLRIRRFYPVD